MNRRMTWAGVAALVMTAAVACTSEDDAAPPASTPSATSSTPTTSSAPPTTPAALDADTDTHNSTAAPHPVSLQAMMAKKYDGRNLRLGRVLARNSAYTRYYVTYSSGIADDLRHHERPAHARDRTRRSS